MKSWNVEGNIISVDFQKVPTDEQLRRQAIDIMLLACDPSMIGAEFGADTAPSEYCAPDKDPA